MGPVRHLIEFFQLLNTFLQCYLLRRSWMEWFIHSLTRPIPVSCVSSGMKFLMIGIFVAYSRTILTRIYQIDLQSRTIRIKTSSFWHLCRSKLKVFHRFTTTPPSELFQTFRHILNTLVLQ